MTSNSERQAAYKERMRNAGYVPVTVWIPFDKKEQLHAYVKRLRVMATHKTSYNKK